MKSTVWFVLSYIVLTIFTYCARLFFAAGSMATIAAKTAPNDNPFVAIGGGFGGALFGMIVTYLLMILVAYFRGKAIEKKYITIFPVIAGLFDIVLVFIPFVPTIMNILTLILGCINDNKPKEIRIVQ